MRRAPWGGGAPALSTVVVALCLALHTSAPAGSGGSYDLSYTASGGDLTDTGVQLLGVSTQNAGPTVDVEFRTGGAMTFCCDNVYEAYLGGTHDSSTNYPDGYVGDLLAPLNNTTWVSYSYYPTSGNAQLLWILGTMSATNTSFNVSIPTTLVPPSTAFSVEVNAEHVESSDPTQLQYSWLGTFTTCWGAGALGNCTPSSPPGSTSGSNGFAFGGTFYLIAAVVAMVAVVTVLWLVLRRSAQRPPTGPPARADRRPPSSPPPGAM